MYYGQNPSTTNQYSYPELMEYLLQELVSLMAGKKDDVWKK